MESLLVLSLLGGFLSGERMPKADEWPVSFSISVEDLRGFPQQYKARDEKEKNHLWGKYLLNLSRYHPNKTQWEGWIKQIRWQEEYWTILDNAHENFLLSEEWQLTQLDRLRTHIGPWRYSQRWSPMKIPSSLPGLK